MESMPDGGNIVSDNLGNVNQLVHLQNNPVDVSWSSVDNGDLWERATSAILASGKKFLFWWTPSHTLDDMSDAEKNQIPTFQRWLAEYNSIADHYAECIDCFLGSVLVKRGMLARHKSDKIARIGKLQGLLIAATEVHAQLPKKHVKVHQVEAVASVSYPIKDPCWFGFPGAFVRRRWTHSLSLSLQHYWSLSATLNSQADPEPAGTGRRITLFELLLDFKLFSATRIPVRNSQSSKSEVRAGKGWHAGLHHTQSIASEFEIFWTSSKNLASVLDAWIPQISKNTASSLLKYHLPMKGRTIVTKFLLLNPEAVRCFLLEQCQNVTSYKQSCPSILPVTSKVKIALQVSKRIRGKQTVR